MGELLHAVAAEATDEKAPARARLPNEKNFMVSGIEVLVKIESDSRLSVKKMNDRETKKNQLEIRSVVLEEG